MKVAICKIEITVDFLTTFSVFLNWGKHLPLPPNLCTMFDFHRYWLTKACALMVYHEHVYTVECQAPSALSEEVCMGLRQTLTRPLLPPSSTHLGLSCRWTADGRCRGCRSTGRSRARSSPRSPPRSWSSCPAGWASSSHIAEEEEEVEIQLTTMQQEARVRNMYVLQLNTAALTSFHLWTWQWA